VSLTISSLTTTSGVTVGLKGTAVAVASWELLQLLHITGTASENYGLFWVWQTLHLLT